MAPNWDPERQGETPARPELRQPCAAGTKETPSLPCCICDMNLSERFRWFLGSVQDFFVAHSDHELAKTVGRGLHSPVQPEPNRSKTSNTEHPTSNSQ